MMPRQDATGRTVTQTPETIEAYRARYPSLVRLAGVHPADLAGVIQWFIGEHERWARATIAQYRAALTRAIVDAEPELGTHRAGPLSASLKLGPRPRKTGPPQTSARKRKSIPKEQFILLMNQLRNRGKHPDDRLAARLLNHNVRLFLRPSEWRTATIEGNILVVRNGKATNGRGLGTHRRLDLKDYGREGVRDLSNLLVLLKKRAKRAQSFRHLWGSLASRIARACEEIGIKRVSPYSTRHCGMANAKCWMSPEEVAASAGHKTTATATSHYAKRHTGWRRRPQGVARPIAEDVAKVVRSPKASREANIDFWKKRAEAQEDTPSFKF